jgi:hypothetical protein
LVATDSYLRFSSSWCVVIVTYYDPILPSDKLAEPNEKGEWVCGNYKIEELNKRKMRVLGLDHKDVKAFIEKEDADCKRWSNYAKEVNKKMEAGLKYKRNRYTGVSAF